MQELLNHPPASKTSDPRFVGRDWRGIRVGELVQPNDIKWAELETPIEIASKVLIPARSPRFMADWFPGID